MNYPYRAEPLQTVGFGVVEFLVCDEDCATEAGLVVTDEITDGWINATPNASCKACGRILILEGLLTWAHYKENP